MNKQKKRRYECPDEKKVPLMRNVRCTANQQQRQTAIEANSIKHSSIDFELFLHIRRKRRRTKHQQIRCEMRCKTIDSVDR